MPDPNALDRIKELVAPAMLASRPNVVLEPKPTNEQVDEQQEHLLRLDVRKRELDDLRDQQERLAARAKSLVLSCQAIEAALAVLNRGA